MVTGRDRLRQLWCRYVPQFSPLLARLSLTFSKMKAQSDRELLGFIPLFGSNGCRSIVIQIAKKQGLKVIASAGSEDKLEYMKSLGADVVFNYKTTKAAEILGREGPIDMYVACTTRIHRLLIRFADFYSYWDNVGGETLDAALMAANFKARFIVSHQGSMRGPFLTIIRRNVG